MRYNIGAKLMLLAVIMLSLAACEGGGTVEATPVAVYAQNPVVLVNYSTIVSADFSNYTSLVKFGSPITFKVEPAPASYGLVSLNTATFSHFSTITTRVVNTNVAGRAWISVKSPMPGKFFITATSGIFQGGAALGGTTAVSFINQPATVEVRVGLKSPQVLNNLGRLDFDLISSLPSPVFDNFSGIRSPLLLAEDTTPLNPPPAAIPVDGITNLHVTSLAGITIVGTRLLPTGYSVHIPLFLFHYVPIPPSVPNFNLANVACEVADQYSTPLPCDLFIISTKYFDVAGNELLTGNEPPPIGSPQ